MKGWPGEPPMEYNVLVAEGAAAKATGEPITDVIFDFGNVLIYWDPAAALLPRYSKESIDRFLDNDISGFYDANDMMDAGAPIEQAIAWMRQSHGDAWADMLTYYVNNFRDSLVGVVPGARVLVDDLKRSGIGVWGLSNWQRELFPLALEYCDILTQLDGRLVSGIVGVRKPDPHIYELALHEFGIDPRRTVFIDDKSMNIVGANEAGMRGIRFEDPCSLREVLIEQGLPIPHVQEVTGA